MDKWDFIKLKNFCTTRGQIFVRKKGSGQVSRWLLLTLPVKATWAVYQILH
jgi:hypothetical protein